MEDKPQLYQSKTNTNKSTYNSQAVSSNDH